MSRLKVREDGWRNSFFSPVRSTVRARGIASWKCKQKERCRTEDTHDLPQFHDVNAIRRSEGCGVDRPASSSLPATPARAASSPRFPASFGKGTAAPPTSDRRCSTRPAAPELFDFGLFFVVVGSTQKPEWTEKRGFTLIRFGISQSTQCLLKRGECHLKHSEGGDACNHAADATYRPF